MVELNGVRIWAIPYRERRALAPRKLPCGSVVEALTEAERSTVPVDLPERIRMPGNPSVLLSFSGSFLLPSGDVAAVYGAVIETLG